MMTSTDNPWSDIPKAAPGSFSRIKVSADCLHRVFWIRDDEGYCGLLIEIDRSISKEVLKKARINIRDMITDVVEVPEENIRALTIKLLETQNRDVFLKLCLDLIEHVQRYRDGDDIFHAVCTRLKKWQSLLSGKIKQLLSAQEVQGLYTELFFIAENMDNPDHQCLLINGWEGPERGQHDFVLNDTAVEIKSVAGNQRGKIRISSEDQLYTHLDKLFLRIYFLSEIHGNMDGESLNGIVTRINEKIIDPEVKSEFEIKLGIARYIDIPDYDLPLIKVKNSRTYIVKEGFPRIIPQTLPESIEAVSYDLVLAGIDSHRTDENIMGSR